MREPDHAKMKVSYDGLIVREGRMSAVDAGTAIIGMANMVSASSRVLYGDSGRVTSQVETNFAKGSFEINFVVEQVAGLLGNVSLDDLLLVLFGPAHSGLLGLIRKLRGREVKEVDVVNRSGDEIALTVKGDDNTIVVNRNVYNLYNNQTARESVASVVKPLERDGMDNVVIGDFEHPQIPDVTIASDEASYYRAPAPVGRTVHKSTSEVYLRVVSLNFKPGSSWRFAQGDTTFFAEIQDPEFWDRVKRYEEKFGDGDTIVADMMTETQEKDGKEKIVRTIIKVKKHDPPRQFRQMYLDETRDDAEHGDDDE